MDDGFRDFIGEVKPIRMKELLEKVIWEAAREEEKREFQELWTGKVKNILLAQKGIEGWLKIEERREANERN